MFSKSLLLLTYASSLMAAPLSVTKESEVLDGSFSVPVVHTALETRDPAVALLKAYQRYGQGLELPELLATSVESNVEKRQNAVVTATPKGNDVEYFCPVTVGSSTLNLNFDTGSNALWVFSSDTPAASRVGHRFYTPAAGVTKQLMSSWSVAYADGSAASGVVYSDTVKIGKMTVTKQAVQAATTISANFVKDTSIDGLMGLGFSKTNTVSPLKGSSFLANAMKTVSTGLFAADLKHNAVGSYSFGAIDTTKFTGSLLYSPLLSSAASNGWWQVDATLGYKVGNTKYTDTQGSKGAVIDSGTTLLLMSDAICKNYYAQVKGASYQPSKGGWIFPCASALPDFYAPVGANYAKIPASLMNYSALDSKKTVCFGSLQSLGSTSLPYILGDPFFKANYAVFDWTNSRFGFAPKKTL